MPLPHSSIILILLATSCVLAQTAPDAATPYPPRPYADSAPRRPQTAPSRSGPTPAEAALLRMANQARAAHGLPALAWSDALARAARDHAARLATDPGDLLHVYPGEPDLPTRASRQGARFSRVAENLARGATVPAQLGSIWMQTPIHRANILDPRMDTVGIGVVELRGLLYAVEDFAQATAISQQGSAEQQEVEVAAALRRSGLATVAITAAARTSCAAGGNAPTDARLVIQWDGPHPADLPDALLRTLQSGTYRSVAIGACPSREVQPGFTTYRVAALLY